MHHFCAFKKMMRFHGLLYVSNSILCERRLPSRMQTFAKMRANQKTFIWESQKFHRKPENLSLSREFVDSGECSE